MSAAPRTGEPRPAPAGWTAPRRRRRGVSLAAAGEPMVWLMGGALAVCVLMIAGLFALILWQGLATFWPEPVEMIRTRDGRVYMGEVTRREWYEPAAGAVAELEGAGATAARSQISRSEGRLRRQLVRTGNYRLTQSHFQWVDDHEVAAVSRPPWALVMERLEWGRFYGMPVAFLELEEAPAEGWSRETAVERAASAGAGPELRAVVRRSSGPELELVAPDDLQPADRIEAVGHAWIGPEAAWQQYRQRHDEVRERWRHRRRLEKVDSGAINAREEQARLAMRSAELDLAAARAAGEAGEAAGARARLAERQARYEETRSWAGQEFARLRQEIDAINAENQRLCLLMETAGEGEMPPRRLLMPLDDVVRAYPANREGLAGKAGIYLSRWWEFLTDEPREANSEGGVFPAIFGTIVMTLLMSVAVVPFGVLAALYLREYARAGLAVSAVRIAVNNLAGVPSIVFGVFGLGFFCYMVGASMDEMLFAARLPNPTYGKGGILWASLTLALLTLPVVIVATEEALAAVPNSMREGSYACGASKWQTIQRIVLPRAMPGITTGMILAIARGAGEVAPLMLVGAVKLAPELPLDGIFPFVHPERSFMHLGFHIYDVGFQSQNSEAAKPMVYTTTLLLIGLIAVLNLAAIWLRNRLRRRFTVSQF